MYPVTEEIKNLLSYARDHASDAAIKLDSAQSIL